MSQTFHLNALGTAVLQSAGGATLEMVTVGKAGDAGSTITLYDNTAGSGTVVAVVSGAAVASPKFDVALTKGLTAVVAGTTAPDVTITVT